MGLLQTIEGSAFCIWVREDSSLWAYPGILFVHVAGMATLVGISAMVALRLVGFSPKLPVPPFERFFPIIWGAFWSNAVSGAVLLATDATAKLASPVFGAKMLLIALGVVDMMLIRRVVFHGPDGGQAVPALGKILAAASLILWFGATTVGRLMGYFGVVSGLPGH
ncbi:MAG: hypothetical protein ABJA98_00210 [Acidobacteriota bacterium]